MDLGIWSYNKIITHFITRSVSYHTINRCSLAFCNTYSPPSNEVLDSVCKQLFSTLRHMEYDCDLRCIHSFRRTESFIKQPPIIWAAASLLGRSYTNKIYRFRGYVSVLLTPSQKMVALQRDKESGKVSKLWLNASSTSNLPCHAW
jgi:hypothetical protein